MFTAIPWYHCIRNLSEALVTALPMTLSSQHLLENGNLLLYTGFALHGHVSISELPYIRNSSSVKTYSPTLRRPHFNALLVIKDEVRPQPLVHGLQIPMTELVHWYIFLFC